MSDFNFLNLTEDIRQHMLAEMNSDVEAGRFYISPRLNNYGVEAYPALMTNAIREGDASTLQMRLKAGIFFNPTYLRQGKAVKMPSNAAQLLAQNEFNRFYIRAVCLKAIANDIEMVEIYRARESSWARPESEMRIGVKIKATDLLEDLRKSVGEEPSLLPEINSGLSVKL
jgi:hypothetical protein